jgi:hypothetical protein
MCAGEYAGEAIGEEIFLHGIDYGRLPSPYGALCGDCIAHAGRYNVEKLKRRQENL